MSGLVFDWHAPNKGRDRREALTVRRDSNVIRVNLRDAERSPEFAAHQGEKMADKKLQSSAEGC